MLHEISLAEIRLNPHSIREAIFIFFTLHRYWQKVVPLPREVSVKIINVFFNLIFNLSRLMYLVQIWS